MISISAFGQQPVNEGFKKCSNHHCVCREKTRLLSRQKYACRDKSFVAKKLYWSRKNICVAKSIL